MKALCVSTKYVQNNLILNLELSNWGTPYILKLHNSMKAWHDKDDINKVLNLNILQAHWSIQKHLLDFDASTLLRYIRK